MKKFIALLLCLSMVFAFTCSYAEETEPFELTVAIGGQFTTLDPALNTETVNNYVLTHTYAMLMEVDENNNSVPGLAESYEVSEDGMEYTFHLCETAVWSDGEPATAGQIVYSILRTISYGPDNAYTVSNLIKYIAGAEEYYNKALEAGESFDCTVEDASSVGVTATDDHTLVVKLAKPCPYFLKMVASSEWAPQRPEYMPQHDSSWAFEVGYPSTGAFVLTEVNENEKAVLTKSATYFKADAVTVDTLNYMVITDQSAQAAAFQTGEVDIALSVSSDTALNYKGTEELWLISKASNYFLAINSAENGPEWAKNVNIRRALALAIDKTALCEVLGGTDLYPVLNGYVPYGLGGISGDFREEGDADGYTLTYNPDQAKELLAAEGYDESNPLCITYKYSNNGIHGDVATMLQSMWAAVGVQVEFACVESGVFYDQLDASDYEIARYGYTATADAIQYLELWTLAMQVTPQIDDKEFDQQVNDVVYVTNPTEYYTQLHALEDYFCDEQAYVIPLFAYNTPALASSGVTGYCMHGGSAYFGAVTAAE